MNDQLLQHYRVIVFEAIAAAAPADRASVIINECTDLISDVGLDSIALMEVIENVQVKSDVTFLAEDYSPERLSTAGDILLLVCERSSRKD